MVLTGSDTDDEKHESVVITDEQAVIYRAMPYATDRLPTAGDLTGAKDFPGATSI